MNLNVAAATAALCTSAILTSACGASTEAPLSLPAAGNTAEPEATVTYHKSTPPFNPSGTQLPELTDPEKLRILDGLAVDWLAQPIGEDANRFDAVAGIGTCMAALTSVIPDIDNGRFDIALVARGQGFQKQNVTVESANTFIDENKSACSN